MCSGGAYLCSEQRGTETRVKGIVWVNGGGEEKQGKSQTEERNENKVVP